MKCPICSKYMKDGTTNNHHLYFPKAKYKGTRRGKMTAQVHVQCHNRFHYHFLHFCLNHKECQGCEFARICVYNTN